MAIRRNNKIIGVSGAQMTALKEDLVNEFQSKRIRFNGVDGVLVTTALQQLFEMAGGRVNIVVSNTLPSPTSPNTQYWVKNYDGQTAEDGRYIIMTDHLNQATYIGSSSTDFSDYYTKEQVDGFLDVKQDKLTSSDETSDLSDTSKFSVVDTTAKTNKRWTLSTLWVWMKGKITSVYYPVGSVVLNMGTNPSANFGGTWQLLATGTKALYLDATAGTTVNEELPNPNISLNTTGEHTHEKGTMRIQGGWTEELYGNTTTSGCIKVTKKDGSRAPNWTGSNSWASAVLDTNTGGWTGKTSENGSHSHTVTIGNSVYKSSGKVRAAGITICAWKRTA